jgi:ABC-type lipoprotein release transport system permease subunit
LIRPLSFLFLWNLQPLALDIVTFVTMTLLLLTVSTVSCLGPAYRVSRLDPNDTLRQQ